MSIGGGRAGARSAVGAAGFGFCTFGVAGWVRAALGPTRDVVIVEGRVEPIPIGVDPELEDAHARSTGFDPRTLADEYVYLRIAPQEVQAWRESNELEGRVLMHDGAWLE